MTSNLPDVDEDSLEEILQAVDDDTDLCQHLREQGSPTNPTRWWVKTPTQKLRTAEIKACVSWPTTWKAGGKGLDQAIWGLLYDYVTEEKGTSSFARELAEVCKVDLEDYRVAIEVTGLREPSAPQTIADFSFGPLKPLLEEHELAWTETMNNRIQEDPSDTAVVLLELQAPDPAKAVDSAYVETERCLDIIATNHLRSVFNGGPPWLLDTGNQTWCWDSNGDAVQTSFRDPWLTRASFSYNATAAEPTSRPPLEASQQPWVDLPDGPLAKALRRAYEFMGAAVRDAREPGASLLLAVAALESVYVPEEDGQKIAPLVARRLQLAVARDAGTTDPSQIKMVYDLRNRIIHSADEHQWDDEEARSTLGDLYRHLDQLAVFAVENSCSTFEELEEQLSTGAIRTEAREWAEDWRSNAAASLKKAQHPDDVDSLQ
jgi:hypothetical protein